MSKYEQIARLTEENESLRAKIEQLRELLHDALNHLQSDLAMEMARDVADLTKDL